VTVEELIDVLVRMPGQLPVELKVYGCGEDSWYALQETQIQDMTNDEGTRICEIDVGNS
jgi:hypothetical protein